jgi:anti-sigma B factor antagonist
MAIPVTTRPGGIAVVRPAGALDLRVAAELKQLLASTVAAGNRYLVVDLGDVSFIDSTGMGALISGLKAAQLSGGDLRLARVGQQVRVALELSSLDHLLRRYGTVEDALAGYTAR